MRRLYHIGISDQHWSLINTFHKDSVSSIKWRGQTSSSFDVNQGVRQGGVLSTDLYKCYVNPLLDMLQNSGIGSTIGNIRCAASACADDICLCSPLHDEAQSLLNISTEFANMERYLLQPTKSVHIKVSHKRSKTIQYPFIMNNCELPTVQKATHLGLIRTESFTGNQKENVEENLKKARRAAYSLFGSGYRGHNGMNIVTVLHLYTTYITPVLLYGLELLLPTETLVNKLEIFQRKFVKQILQVADNTANPAIYLLTGLLPIQAQIHIRALSFLHNICSQSEDSIERQIFVRQMNVKTINSHSWVSDIRKILWQYDLGDLEEISNNLLSKYAWKSKIHSSVNNFWLERINSTVKLYSTLHFLRHDTFKQGKVLPILAPEFTSRESDRLTIKLRIVTGTYLLQSTRKNFNQYNIDPTCLICRESSETVIHFVLDCALLDSVRRSILSDIACQWRCITNTDFEQLEQYDKLQVIINSWFMVKNLIRTPKSADFHELERHCSRLLFSLDCARQVFLAGLAHHLPPCTKSASHKKILGRK